MSNTRRPTPRDPRVAAAAFEALESRICRSATYSVNDFDHNGTLDLRVRGSSSKEHVVITENPDAGTTTLWLDQNTNNIQDSKDVIKNFAGGSFGTIDVDLASGDDSFEYTATSAYDDQNRSLLFDMGSGNDKMKVFAAGDDGGVFNSHLNCDFDLDTGNDTADIRFGAVDHSKFDLNIDGNSGDDSIHLEMTGDITGSSSSIAVELGSGKNKLELLSPGAVNEGSNYFVTIVGGTGVDTVTTALTADIEDARLFITANLQAGNDVFTNTFDLQNFDVRALGVVVFNVNGGDGNDTILVTRNGTFGPADIEENSLLDFELRGGNGNDNVKLDLGGNAENQRGIFLAGKLIVNMDGQGGDDTVSAELSFSIDPASYGDLTMTMKGGDGKDKMNFKLLDFFPPEDSGDDDEEEEPDPDEIPDPPDPIGFTYGPAGYVLIDGQVGTDSCKLEGQLLTNVRVRNCESLVVVPYVDDSQVV